MRDIKTQRDFTAFTRRVGSDWIGEQIVRLGDYSGEVLSDTPGRLLARQVNGRVIEVINRALAPAKIDLHALVRRSRIQPDVWQITEILEDYESPAAGGEIAYHHKQHEFSDQPGADTVWINRKQILQLTVLVDDGPAFIVKIAGSVIRTSSGLAAIATQTLDLSSYLPTAGARFVTIQSSEAGSLSVVTGTDFASPLIAALADVPEADSDKYMLAFVLLFAEMEELLDKHIRIPYQFHPGGTTTVGWGDIFGDLEDQIDLQSAFDAKADIGHEHGSGELVMEDGVSSPPVPVETEDGEDWVYSG